jgi:hypothetical protein
VVSSECKKAGLPAPSYNTIRARVKAVDLKEIVHHRVGLKAARACCASSVQNTPMPCALALRDGHPISECA